MLEDARLLSGVALFVYLCSHFLNHSLGLVSAEFQERGRELFVAFWRHPVMWIAAPLALVVHLGTVLWSTLRRRSLKMTRLELLRFVLGLLALVLITGHLLQTRVMNLLYGIDDNYHWVLGVGEPVHLWLLGLASVIAWTHACIGLYFWLRLRSWFGHASRPLFAFALLLPTFAVLGAINSAREIWSEEAATAIAERTLAATGLSFDDYRELAWKTYTLVVAGLIGAVLALFASRTLFLRTLARRGSVAITFDSGDVAKVPLGTSVLEASWMNGLDHAAICGGRGRCSTCRVRVVEGADDLPFPDRRELAVLRRVSAPPKVRLACQLRPTQPISVVRLIHYAPGYAELPQSVLSRGLERSVVVMFADLRGFTGLSERRMAYDVVFILNQYFHRMGKVIERGGGYLDKFIGDGIMAIFGMEVDEETAARQALATVIKMADELKVINDQLATELGPRPLKLGVGLHAGEVILGEMGYGHARQITAIGDVVNVASRLTTASKQLHGDLVMSSAVATASGLDWRGIPAKEVGVRGRLEPLGIHVVESFGDLATILESQLR